MVATLEGNVVLITGAGAGFGLGMAPAFHAAGAMVALGDLRQETVERAAADLGGGRTFAGQVDARDEASVQSFCNAAEHALGPVTIAVANAGIYPTRAVLDMEVGEWDRVIETNLRGTFLTCQAAAQSMIAGGRPGKIITISSGAYASARPGASHYCASKAGIVMFSKTLAMELAEARINVNCIAPGYIQADGAVPDSAFNRALLKNIPWGRFGTPADVADTGFKPCHTRATNNANETDFRRHAWLGVAGKGNRKPGDRAIMACVRRGPGHDRVRIQHGYMSARH